MNIEIPNQATLQKEDDNEKYCLNCGFSAHVNKFVIDYDTAEERAYLQCPNCNHEVNKQENLIHDGIFWQCQ